MDLRSDFNKAISGLYTKDECGVLWRRVLCEVCGVEMSKTYFISDADITLEQGERVMAVAGRLAQGEPLEYILGFAEFCSHRFNVTPAVLIPRLETQELVSYISSLYHPDATLRILDIGTGSGCIAVSLALYYRDASVTAIDVSTEALQVAKANAEALGAGNVEFREIDFLKVSSGEKGIFNTGMFDVIVSNPPYVRPSEKRTMPPRVLDYEPSGALFVPEDDPLLFYRHIALFATSHLNPHGIAAVEINQWLGAETEKLFKDYGFNAELMQDYYKENRFIVASQI